MGSLRAAAVLQYVSVCVLFKEFLVVLIEESLKKWNICFSPLESELELLSKSYRGKTLIKPLLYDLGLN